MLNNDDTYSIIRVFKNKQQICVREKSNSMEMMEERISGKMKHTWNGREKAYTITTFNEW